MRKQTFSLSLCLLTVVILAAPAFAHSGRTDSQGGHTNHSTGEYHYHHGYPAHQHDNGICPYDFDDKTGQNSGVESNNANKSDGSTSAAAKVKTETSEEKQSSSPILLVSVVGIFLFLIFKYIKYILRTRKERREYEEMRNKYLLLYGGKTRNEIAKIAGMPPLTTIGDDNLPKSQTGDKWGYKYTFYVSQSGKSFHCHRSCHHAAIIPKNAANLGNRVPCSICRPQKPDLNWYWEYRRILNIIEEYHVDIRKE